MHDKADHIAELHERLEAVEKSLEREMRTRGFDPAQIDTTALPSQLADLAAQREQLRTELEELRARTKSEQ